ncbi:hypothetical protein N7522_002730 [Penicillium canescens]|nr:hypothetical protein N7522_002730 [Penicillium canescens]
MDPNSTSFGQSLPTYSYAPATNAPHTGYISSPESLRENEDDKDNKTPLHSLPSIREALDNNSPLPYPMPELLPRLHFAHTASSYYQIRRPSAGRMPTPPNNFSRSLACSAIWDHGYPHLSQLQVEVSRTNLTSITTQESETVSLDSLSMAKSPIQSAKTDITPVSESLNPSEFADVEPGVSVTAQTRNWSHSATDAPSQQRRRLLNRFLELDEIPEEYVSLDESLPRTLTPEEIDTILKPWRSDNDLRRKAYYMSKDNVLVFLRTHYNPHDDGKLKGWIHKNDLFEENAWWACLNDPYLFNFGPDWQRVYEIMPEVAGHVDRKRRSDDPSKLKHFRASSARSLQTRDQECLHGWRESLVKMTGELAKPPPNVTFATYIVIADQEAFQTGRLRLFCLDNGRKIVWEPRVDRKPAEIMKLIRRSGSISGV